MVDCQCGMVLWFSRGGVTMWCGVALRVSRRGVVWICGFLVVMVLGLMAEAHIHAL